MMFGYLDRAREAAERAVALAPDLARTQSVLGFANLVEFRTGPAKAAFERAIGSTRPTRCPGSGSAWRRSARAASRRGARTSRSRSASIPTTPCCAPISARRTSPRNANELANEQYQMAKELDPLDPTPFLYEAIKQQTEGRPGEALENVQRSIELNDNRAVYRSRLLLDSDRAARGTSLALIYDDLGFLEPGINEASRSLNFDPANAAAHRFLSDIYVGVRRREIARVSNLLQAQMLQDLNINPIQPSLSEANLNLVTQGGPAQAGFNEFTPLFERNQVQLNATGLVGNENTYGAEGVASAIYDRYSISAGAFGYWTDGWRKNNDINQNVQDVFFQTAITPELNAQLEFRRRRSDFGDLAFNFDPDFLSENLDQTFDQDTYRAGLRYSPLPSSDFLASFIYSDLKNDVKDSEDIDVLDVVLSSRGRSKDESTQTEGQYIYRQDLFNITTGFGYSDVDRNLDLDVDLDGFPFFNEFNKQQITEASGYVYGN